MADKAIMEIKDVAEGIIWQSDHAANAGAHGTARIVRAMLKVIEGNTACGRRMANWEGFSLEAAVPLRIAGGLHHLLLSGTDHRLERVYAGQISDQTSVDALVTELVAQYDTQLLPWLDGPPQTNEAGRSWAFMAGMKWLSPKLGPKFALHELGASAGINTMMERYFYDLGGVLAGPKDSPMRIIPEWRGNPPPDHPVEIVSTDGCDQAPSDLSQADQALRIKSYVWPEAFGRMERIDAAIALANKSPPKLLRQDAGDYVRQVLMAKQDQGVTRVINHSIVWQYIPSKTRDNITRMIEDAGASATLEYPLAWIALETNRETFSHELRVRFWPNNGQDDGQSDGQTDGEKGALLAEGHPHGEWAKWHG